MNLKIKRLILFLLFIPFIFAGTSNDYISVNWQANDIYLPAFKKAAKKYKDLEGCSITVKEKNIKTSAACRPAFTSVFKSSEKRNYLIIVNTKKTHKNIPLISEMPDKAAVGLFAHELAHIVDYSSSGTGKIIGRGIDMLNKKTRSEFESEIDSIAIWRGMGREIIAFKKYIRSNEDISDKYIEFKKDIYLSVSEAKEELDNYKEAPSFSTFKENESAQIIFVD